MDNDNLIVIVVEVASAESKNWKAVNNDIGQRRVYADFLVRVSTKDQIASHFLVFFSTRVTKKQIFCQKKMRGCIVCDTYIEPWPLLICNPRFTPHFVCGKATIYTHALKMDMAACVVCVRFLFHFF